MFKNHNSNSNLLSCQRARCKRWMPLLLSLLFLPSMPNWASATAYSLSSGKTSGYGMEILPDATTMGSGALVCLAGSCDGDSVQFRIDWSESTEEFNVMIRAAQNLTSIGTSDPAIGVGYLDDDDLVPFGPSGFVHPVYGPDIETELEMTMEDDLSNPIIFWFSEPLEQGDLVLLDIEMGRFLSRSFVSIEPVPEPSTGLLFGFALVTLAAMRRFGKTRTQFVR